MKIENEKDADRIARNLYKITDDDLVKLYDDIKNDSGKYNNSTRTLCEKEIIERFRFKVVADKQMNELDFGI